MSRKGIAYLLPHHIKLLEVLARHPVSALPRGGTNSMARLVAVGAAKYSRSVNCVTCGYSKMTPGMLREMARIMESPNQSVAIGAHGMTADQQALVHKSLVRVRGVQLCASLDVLYEFVITGKGREFVELGNGD